MDLGSFEFVDELDIVWDTGVWLRGKPLQENQEIRELIKNQEYEQALELCESQIIDPKEYIINGTDTLYSVSKREMPYLPNQALTAIVNLKLILNRDISHIDMFGLRNERTERPSKFNYTKEYDNRYKELFYLYIESNPISLTLKTYFEIDSIPRLFIFNKKKYIYPTEILLVPAMCIPLNRSFKEMDREAENLARKDVDLPGVGEGWVSEMRTLKTVKKYFHDYTVIHQARLPFLGQQSLDIYIPEICVGIEYQGRQHYYPVEYFGGKKALGKNIERDSKKMKLCQDNGVSLFYVRYDEDIEDRVIEIFNSIYIN